MNPTFDLLKSPWVSCIQRDGTPVELGLRGTLAKAHELREVHGESPLVTAALQRLLLAVLHRIFGPANHREWQQLWQAGHWDMGRLDAYLEQWHHRFDLFDPERPFYQARDERVKPKSVISLIHDVASGNNPTLFDHHTEAEGITLTPAQAARMLVAAQAFGLGGLSGLRQKFTDAPCASGIIFLVQGDSLFETLALNLVRYPDEGFYSTPDDRPAWEMDDPYTPDRRIPLGYLDYLTWQNRRVLLLPEAMNGRFVVRQVTVAPALRLGSGILGPMKHYRKDEKRGPVPLPFVEGRALWRDSAALFRLHAEGYQSPRAFHWLAEMVEKGHLPRSQTLRYMALGMSKKQAKVHFFRSEHMPLPLRYLKETELVEILDQAVQMAEKTSRQLWGATRTLAKFVLSLEADAKSARQPAQEDLNAVMKQWAVERQYWPRLERPFLETMEVLPDKKGQALEEWRSTLHSTAWEAFDHAARGVDYDVRKLKALVRARRQLAAGLAKALPDPSQ